MADTTTATAERPLLRTIQGIVASDKGNKTIKVVVNYQTRHPKYGKYLKRRTVLHAGEGRGRPPARPARRRRPAQPSSDAGSATAAGVYLPSVSSTRPVTASRIRVRTTSSLG